MPRWAVLHALAVVNERFLRPADGPLHGDAGVFVADRIGRAFIEHHQDVAAECQLDVHGGGRRELVRVAIQMRLEGDAFVGDLAQPGKAEHLVAAGIGQDRARPGHETVKSPEVPDQFVAGAQEEMVGVAEDDAGLEIVPQIALAESFDGGLRADRHEDRGRDVAVRGVQDAGAGAGDRAFGEEFEDDLARQPRLYCATGDAATSRVCSTVRNAAGSRISTVYAGFDTGAGASSRLEITRSIMP